MFEFVVSHCERTASSLHSYVLQPKSWTSQTWVTLAVWTSTLVKLNTIIDSKLRLSNYPRVNMTEEMDPDPGGQKSFYSLRLPLSRSRASDLRLPRHHLRCRSFSAVTSTVLKGESSQAGQHKLEG